MEKKRKSINLVKSSKLLFEDQIKIFNKQRVNSNNLKIEKSLNIKQLQTTKIQDLIEKHNKI